MKNKLVCVGFAGEMTVYLNVEKDEAVKRYKEEHPGWKTWAPLEIKEIEFDDKFGVYDVWGLE